MSIAASTHFSNNNLIENTNKYDLGLVEIVEDVYYNWSTLGSEMGGLFNIFSLFITVFSSFFIYKMFSKNMTSIIF